MAARTSPQYFPNNLELPLPTNHKTWHTERLCPPLLAYALGTDQALFIAQLHYWLQKDNVGVYKHGFHWIYNAEWEWREQFPWLSEHTIGRIRRALERLGYVVSNDFNRNPLDRTKHSTLDYYLIAQETGWNPLGLDLNREYPHPPVFTKGVRQRGRHKSDETPLVYLPVDGDEPDSLKPPETVNSAKMQNAFCKKVIMHSAFRPVSSIYKEIPNTSKSNSETDLKIEPTESSQGVGGSQLLVNENAPSIADRQKKVNLRVIEFSGEGQISAAADPSLINDEEIPAIQQFLASLNASVERANSERTLVLDLTRPIRIPGLDEESHEILWKHQASLLELNADLYAERIQKALMDNPQHLESAIKAFFEANAKGPLEPKQATGFLYNALRLGWKPKQSSVASSQTTRACYTPHPLMVEPPKASTLEEMVERKRHLWKHAPIMRQNIEVWAEETPGIIIGPDGPEFAGEGALAFSPTEPAAAPALEPAAPHEKPAPTIPEASTKSIAEPTELVTTPAAPPEANALTPAVTSVASPRADSPATTNTLAADPLVATAPTLALVQPPDLMATTKAPAAANPTVSALPATPLALTSGPGKPPAALVPSSVEPLKVGERVLWDNCPAHCASWNPFTISNIIGGMVWLDIYEKPVPLSDLRRAP